ncbi:hypothetical protein [Paucisalibacillus sp. EB02]|uniref:hypothetical protein n=1 Tax=Paucisalibacillus sp. EB02 TaxID=1347087 RepID=UPI001E520D60|nr:hypothetical protein [Paucisalibacillus sp. EB02]
MIFPSCSKWVTTDFGLDMPEVVKDVAIEPGYFAISQEVLGDYAGDYIVLSLTDDHDT